MKKIAIIALLVGSAAVFAENNGPGQIRASKIISADINGVSFVFSNQSVQLQICEDNTLTKDAYLKQIQPAANYANAHKLAALVHIDVAAKCVWSITSLIESPEDLK